MREYRYVGSEDFIPKGEFPPRTRLDGVETLAAWMNKHVDEMDLDCCIPATFVVDVEGVFWIADRGSEHVACARLGKVLSAGEVFFSGQGSTPRCERITNQSTGYCPEPSSWPAVEKALEEVGIEFPGAFDPAFVFRRCPACANLAIVKEDDYTCLMCDAELPERWNIDPDPCAR